MRSQTPLPSAPDLSFEIPLWEGGVRLIAGVDEAGRGALAGPVAAGALVLPSDPALTASLPGVRDSKQMTPRQRETCAALLQKIALAWGVGYASAREIDDLGILPATRLAICRALELLGITPQHLLVDYLSLPEIQLPQTSLVRGDCRSLSIAGASILAKTARDARMQALDREFPGYGFSRHKGYGTAAHRDALRRLGPSSQHRMCFSLLP